VKRLVLAIPLLAASLAGCIPDRPWPDAPRDPYALAQSGIDSLRLAGRWSDALASAAERERRFAHLARVPRWRRADAAREAVTLRAIASLPESARAELALAERSLREGERLLRNDSLALAEPAFEGAWRARARWLGARHVETLAASLALARAAFWAGHLARSEPLARAALAELTARVGPEHPLTGQAEELVGWQIKSFSPAGVRGTAAPHYDRAARVFATSLGPVSVEEADVFSSLANLYRLDEHVTRADVEALFRNSIELRRGAPGCPPDDIAAAMTALGVLLVQEERWRDAERLLGEALVLRRASPQPPRLASYTLTLSSHGQALQRLGRRREAIAELAEAAALRETLWARTDRDEGGALMLNFIPYRELAVALAASGRAGEAFEAFERGNSRRLAERLLGDTLAARDPWHGLLARVQRVLPPDAALVFWIRNPMRMRHGDSPLWACVVRREGPPRWRALPIALDGGGRPSRDRFGFSIRAASGWPIRGADTLSMRGVARRMGREWFDPLEADLAGVREIVVSQPEMLSGVPLEALVSADGRWLSERFRISYTPSALLWARWREQPRPRTALADRPALVVGDPSRDPDASHLPPLAAARGELEAIASRFPHATLLVDAEATADRLRALAASGELARYGLIHVASHSDVEARLPMRTALVLAAGRAADVERAHLRAAEIAGRWHLGAELVSLATCWSQAGAASATDGSFGMEQAFFAAGARSLLVSLWPVDDEATALFMRRFYEDLTRPGAPVSRSEALQEARRWLRGWQAPDGTRPFAHPCYWAAFVLVGDAG
jgi:tetratricopeptide (TPR) repeat protein